MKIHEINPKSSAQIWKANSEKDEEEALKPRNPTTEEKSVAVIRGVDEQDPRNTVE